MARVKSAVKGESILTEEKAASTQSLAVDNPRKTLIVRVSDMDDGERKRRHEAYNLPTCISLEAAACPANSVKKAVASPQGAPNSVTAKGLRE
jgi:hypothetical protein